MVAGRVDSVDDDSVVDLRQVAGLKLDVHDRSDDLDDLSLGFF